MFCALIKGEIIFIVVRTSYFYYALLLVLLDFWGYIAKNIIEIKLDNTPTLRDMTLAGTGAWDFLYN